MAVGRKAGTPKSGGRKKGTPNKLNATAKENIQCVFTRLGGTAAMAEWAKENKTEFYKLYGRLLPHELTGENGSPITVVIDKSLARTL